jgi:hypothetical protein
MQLQTKCEKQGSFFVAGGLGNSLKTQQMTNRLKALKVPELRILLKEFGESDPKLKKLDDLCSTVAKFSQTSSVL